MQDHEKSKEQLIDELQDLRARLADLEPAGPSEKEAQSSGTEQSRYPRNDIEAPIVFIGGFNLIYAQGLNLSQGGVCFEISEHLPFEMEFDLGGEVHKHAANLIWMNRLPTGRSRLGLEFESANALALLEAYKESAAKPSPE